MSKNTFMCGERACVDKKEFNEFFAENLIFEIKNPIDKKKKSLDLVNLNTSSTSKNIDNKSLKKKNKNFIKKINKKESEAVSRAVIANDNPPIKIVKKKIENQIYNNKDTDAVDKDTSVADNIKTENTKKQFSLCEKVIDCDIEKIADLLAERDKEKKFPNINTKK